MIQLGRTDGGLSERTSTLTIGDIMKKKVTERVTQANRENAGKSTGATSPRGKAIVGRNALKHGLLARVLTFKDDEERAAFRLYAKELADDMAPADAVEGMLIEQIATSWYRLSRCQRLEQRLRLQDNPASGAVLEVLKGQSHILGVEEKAFDTHRSTPWECQQLEILVANADKQSSESSFPDTDTQKRLQVKARFANPLDSLLRYRRAITKDLYQALKELRNLRKQRTKS
jgi:hypothetical protein